MLRSSGSGCRPTPTPTPTPRAWGKAPLLVESYRNGMPLFSVREGGDKARPLGFRYGPDGLCANVTARELEGGRWWQVRLSRHETTVLGRFLCANEYAAGAGPSSAPFGAPWIRIEA